MPTYDYKCSGCGHEFEAFQSITDAPLKKCPQCGKRRLERLIGPGAALIFRGSGFYCTDYRKGGSSTPATAKGGEKDASKAGQGGSGGSGDGGEKD